MDRMALALAGLRWIHILAGITWIGHLYFFNLVNGPFAKTMDADTKKKVVPELMPRALWWFRWGAMVTFLAGIALFTLKYMWLPGGTFGANNLFLDAQGHVSERAKWILFGMLFGTIMWFNVWFIIWPIQRKLIGWTRAGEKNPAADGLTRKAFLASRTNTYLSGAMLVGMIAPNHFPSFSLPVAVGLFAAGAGVMHVLIGQGPKVTTEV